MHRILVIAAELDLRRSLQFALEAEGYSVTWAADIEGEDPPGAFDCTVVDHHCVGNDHLAAVAFCQAFRPVVLLANSVPHTLSPWVFRTVEKPMLGPALTTAIREAIEERALPK